MIVSALGRLKNYIYTRAVESEFKSNPIFPIFSDYPIFVFTLNCPLPKSYVPPGSKGVSYVT